MGMLCVFMDGLQVIYSQPSIQSKNPSYNILNRWLNNICLNACCNVEFTTWGEKINSYCWATQENNTAPKPVFLAIPTNRYLNFSHSLKYLLNMNMCYVISTGLVTITMML